MDVAVNHLKVWQTPKIEQTRPGRVSVFAPDAEKRDAMVNFGIPPQPPAALSAPPTLDAPQQLDLATGAFQNCHASTQALCQAAFWFGPLPHRSMCQPKR